MIKKILQWAVPTLLILLLSHGVWTFVQMKTEKTYEVVVNDKWRSSSSGKYSVTEYHYVEFCTTSEPVFCTKVDYRESSYNNFTIGSIRTVELEKVKMELQNWELWGVTAMALSSAVVLTVIIGLIILVLQWIYSEDKS